MSSRTSSTREGAEDPSLPRTPRPRLTLRLVQEHVYPIPRHGTVRCRLWRMHPDPPRPEIPPAYAVSLEGLGMRRACLLGTDGDSAAAVIRLLVTHTVTPVGLRDVLEELTETNP